MILNISIDTDSSFVSKLAEEAESLDNAIFQETLGFDLENMK